MSSNGSRSIQFYQGVFPFEQAQKERASNLFTLLEENDIFQNQTAQYSGLLRNDPQFYLVDTQGIYIKSSQRYIPIFLHDDQTSPTSNDSLKTIHKELMSCFSNRHIRKMTPRNSTKRELGKTASTTQRSHSLNTIPQRKPKEEQASESPSVQTAPAERAQNLQNQLDTATNEVAKLQEQLRESTRKIEFDGVTINAFLDRQEIDSDSLRKKQQEIIKLKKEIKNLQKRIHDLEQAQEAKAQEIQALQAQLAQAQADADERAQNLQNQLRTNEQNLTTKQEEIDRLSTRLENAEIRIRALTADQESKTQEIQALQEKLAQAQANAEERAAALQNAQQQLQQAQNQTTELQQRIHVLEKAQEAKAREIQALQAQLAQAQLEKAQLEQAQADADARTQALQNQLRTNEQNLTTKQEEIDRLSTRLENAEIRIRALTADQESKTQEIQALQEKLEKAQQQLQQAQNQTTERQQRIQDLEQAQEAKTQENQTLQEQLRTNELNLATKQAEIDQLSAQLENAQRRALNLQNQLDQAQSAATRRKERIRKARELLKKHIQEQERTAQQSEGLQQRIQDLEQAQEAKTQEMQALQAQLAHATQNLQKTKQTIVRIKPAIRKAVNLWKKAQQLHEQKTKEIAALHAKIENLQTQLGTDREHLFQNAETIENLIKTLRQNQEQLNEYSALQEQLIPLMRLLHNSSGSDEAPTSAQLLSSLTAIRKQLNALSALSTSLGEVSQRLQLGGTTPQEQLDNLVNRIQQLQQLEELPQHNREIEEQLARANTENAQLRGRVEELEEQQQASLREVDEIEPWIQNLVSTNSQLRQFIQRFQAENRQLRERYDQENREVSASQAESMQSREEVRALREQLEEQARKVQESETIRNLLLQEQEEKARLQAENRLLSTQLGDQAEAILGLEQQIAEDPFLSKFRNLDRALQIINRQEIIQAAHITFTNAMKRDRALLNTRFIAKNPQRIMAAPNWQYLMSTSNATQWQYESINPQISLPKEKLSRQVTQRINTQSQAAFQARTENKWYTNLDTLLNRFPNLNQQIEQVLRATTDEEIKELVNAILQEIYNTSDRALIQNFLAYHHLFNHVEIADPYTLTERREQLHAIKLQNTKNVLNQLRETFRQFYEQLNTLAVQREETSSEEETAFSNRTPQKPTRTPQIKTTSRKPRVLFRKPNTSART